jgi:hypothetical protein
MQRFEKSVSNVSSTVLVPSRLRDMEVPGKKESRIPPALANTDNLYNFYVMLHDVKKELNWGPGTGAVAAATMGSTGSASLASSASSSGSSGRSTPRSVGSSMGSTTGLLDNNKRLNGNPVHQRQTSDESMKSLGSAASSSGSSDTDSEVDSLLTDRLDRTCLEDEDTSHLAIAIRHHLQGLHTMLHQLADSADFLSRRYQEEIEECL